MFGSIVKAIRDLTKEIRGLRGDVQQNTKALKEIVSELDEDEPNLSLEIGDEVPK